MLHCFNKPTSNEVAFLMVSYSHENYDICVQDRNLKCVSQTHPFYVLWYPFILWNGLDGYHFNIPQIESETGEPITNKMVLSNDFYSYQLM